ncbi:MAG: Ribonuclease P protein component [Candidatus Moranbacteria bacterium GW2011_GWE2_47_10]|nr:MAG: Ribonuclease P protein component [Candidatus Moranbacteria bacterium GW2011_GWE2_47_10]
MIHKENRLKKKEDFQKTYLKGKFFSLGQINIRFARNDKEVSRIGFVVGKNYSKKAVDRNRARRLLRASASELIERVLPGFDIVMGIRKPLPGKKTDKESISLALEKMLEKNKLLKK